MKKLDEKLVHEIVNAVAATLKDWVEEPATRRPIIVLQGQPMFEGDVAYYYTTGNGQHGTFIIKPEHNWKPATCNWFCNSFHLNEHIQKVYPFKLRELAEKVIASWNNGSYKTWHETHEALNRYLIDTEGVKQVKHL